MPKLLFMLWCFTRTAIFFNCTICLHSTLFICTALIINLLRSVDNFVFYLHGCLHLSTLVCIRLHSSALVYTCLHSTLFVCTALIINLLRSVDNFVFYLHGCLHLSTLVYTRLHANSSSVFSATAAWRNACVGAVRTIMGGRFFGCSNQKSVSPIPNYVGGITAEKLGAEVRNEGECRQVHTACRRV